ncbi:hypothetical protein CkaCkLH20_12185 [Colletotrichum karsti]|uniref:Uncharacterized protein n=1 Tax=Colletotrichum karsti TaxID=1095194 RepID=A0A9P6HSX9_9PEZI|nr:uncharacterized protein CkaCkLH20_12185 [Colletotrichum karsti]KAF9870338.1 hypothetical protein CkaCkLH20_12185 [Colletotrichum karsti]
MKRLTPLLLAAIGTAAAQTTTKIDVVVPYMGESSWHVSVEDAKPAATTYILGCEVDMARTGCASDDDSVMNGAWDGLTIISGPKTFAVHHSFSDRDMSIGYEGSTVGNEMRYMEIQTMNGATVRMGSFNGDKRAMTVHLTATAGLEKLAAAATMAPETGVSSGLASATSGTGSAAGPTPTPNAGSGLRVARAEVLAGVVGVAVLGVMMI